MQTRWNETWSHLSLTAPSNLFDELMDAYAEDHRRYHTVQHLRGCFGLYDSAPVAEGKGPTVELALWFHDVVYATRETDNEERSAQRAERALRGAGVAEDTVKRVAELILLTNPGAEPPSDPEGSLLVDLDLGIFAAPPARYAEYESQIRGEYDWVPEVIFSQARAGILRQFLERPHIYQTQAFRERFEERARNNLGLAIEMLEAVGQGDD
jgi:predicted metal-dependent HD superfamily phosphohydrolase